MSGQIILPASAMEPQTLEKEVGQTIHFKACVKNIGNVEATYVIVVEWRVDGAEAWESGGNADVRLLHGALRDPVHRRRRVHGGDGGEILRREVHTLRL